MREGDRVGRLFNNLSFHTRFGVQLDLAPVPIVINEPEVAKVSQGLSLHLSS